MKALLGGMGVASALLLTSCGGSSASSGEAVAPASPPPPSSQSHAESAEGVSASDELSDSEAGTEPGQDEHQRPGERKQKARKNALMRRFDSDDSEQTMDVPRSCGGDPQSGALAEASPGKANAATDATPPPNNDDRECYPPRRFVDALCAGTYPGVALVMFAKSSPWQRAYLNGPTKAWTTAPGAQDQERLAFREEVLILQGQPKGGALQVSNGASFYALRWNGSCVKLNEEEVTTLAPWQKIASPVRWDYLDDGHQSQLLQVEKIATAHSAWRKDCKGARMGSKPPACERSEQRLSDLVVGHIRGGAELPDPVHKP